MYRLICLPFRIALRHIYCNNSLVANPSSSTGLPRREKYFSISLKLERRIKGFKYTCQLTAEEQKVPESDRRKLQCFVACTARATNDYADRTTLLYMINRYI